MSPPLAGLRVLELAAGVAGPYAGRLLAMLGATVVKVEPDGGDPARTYPVDERCGTDPSPLWVWLSEGKQIGGDADVAWADIVIDDRVRSQLSEIPPDVVWVSVTAWGFDADDPGRIEDELLVQAASGFLSNMGEEGRGPVRMPGWQSQCISGAYAAASGLAVLAERGSGHIDIAWVSCMTSGIEGAAARALHNRAGKSATGPSSAPAWKPRPLSAFPAGALPCKDGHVVVGTVRPVDWRIQCQQYRIDGLVDDERFDAGPKRVERRDELWEIVGPWYAARTKREIFDLALGSGWALGMVMTATDTLTDPHLAQRGFLGTTADGVTIPVQPWRAPGLPVKRSDGPPIRLPRLRDLKVIELTRAWAGPFVGRFLAAFGADVVKVEGARSPDGWRTPMPWTASGVEPPDGIDPDALTYDVSPLYNGLNRGKRGVAIDMTTADGRDVFLKLAAVADLVVVNMTARVLGDWQLSYETLADTNPRLILINMPALGATGPYKDLPGYGTIIEGMGGLAARAGYADEGARASDTYFPDAVAGIHATLAALSALAQREATGHGCSIDLSQQEVTWLQNGEAIALASMEGRDPDRLADREPAVDDSGLFALGEGAWVARVGGRERAVENFSRASGWQVLLEGLDGFETLIHPVTGEREYLRIPVRIDGTPLSSSRASPCFGQHTAEVLDAWAGIGAAEVARLEEDGAIGGEPRGVRR